MVIRCPTHHVTTAFSDSIYPSCRLPAIFKALANIGIDGYVNKGPDADLQELVNIVKEKLEPFSIDNVHTIIDNAKMEEE